GFVFWQKIAPDGQEARSPHDSIPPCAWQAYPMTSPGRRGGPAASLAGSSGRTAITRLVCYFGRGTRQSEPPPLASPPSGRAAAGHDTLAASLNNAWAKARTCTVVAYHPCFATRLGGVSGGKETQGWRDSSHTAMAGAGKFGSAKLPMATATYPGKPSPSQ